MEDQASSLTIRDAARATGLSVKAVQRRIERGTLPAQLEGGVRRIPLGALLEAHLVVEDGTPGALRPAMASPGMLSELQRRVEELEARLAALERGKSTDTDGARG